MTVAVYTRTARPDETALDQQAGMCRDWLSLHPELTDGHEVRVVAETSPAHAAIPLELNGLLLDPEVDLIVVTELTRLSRRTGGVVRILETGVRVVSIAEDFDSEDPAAQMTLALMSHLESVDSRRSADGARRARAARKAPRLP